MNLWCLTVLCLNVQTIRKRIADPDGSSQPRHQQSGAGDATAILQPDAGDRPKTTLVLAGTPSPLPLARMPMQLSSISVRFCFGSSNASLYCRGLFELNRRQTTKGQRPQPQHEAVVNAFQHRRMLMTDCIAYTTVASVVSVSRWSWTSNCWFQEHCCSTPIYAALAPVEPTGKSSPESRSDTRTTANAGAKDRAAPMRPRV